MILVWPIVVAAILGLFCGAWVPLLLFTFIAFVGTLGSALSMWLAGLEPGWTVLALFAVMTALQAGYLIGLIGRNEFEKPSRSTPRSDWANSEDYPNIARRDGSAAFGDRAFMKEFEALPADQADVRDQEAAIA